MQVLSRNYSNMPIEEAIVSFFTSSISPILSFGAIVISAVVAYLSTRKQTAAATDQELRKDLMELYEEQSKEIRQLNKDYIELRKDNVHILEQNAALRNALSEEKTKNSAQVDENMRLNIQIQVIRDEKAQLANRVMILESELSALRKVIEKQNPVLTEPTLKYGVG